jgi:hypothetical protein
LCAESCVHHGRYREVFHFVLVFWHWKLSDTLNYGFIG